MGRTMLVGFKGALDAADAGHVDAAAKTQLLLKLKTARQSGDLAGAVALRSLLLGSMETDAERVDMLQGLAEDALAAAANALARALEVAQKNPGLLRRLRAVYEAAGLWREAVDVSVALAETVADRTERARAFVSAAELSARDPEGIPRAMALYDAAIADDAESAGAFEALEKLLIQAGDHKALESAYERQMARLHERGAEAAELALVDKLARLRAEKLGDARGAVQALDRLVARRPSDVDARGRLAALLETMGQEKLAVRCLEIATQHAPTHADTYRAMQRVFARLKDADRAYQACSVLVQLGEADIDEQLDYQQHAPQTTTGASRPLDGAAWAGLLPEDMDADLLEVLLAVAPAAVAVRLDQMRAAKQLPALDARDRQEPEKSTVSAVRAVAYASWLLGLPLPAVYARNTDDVPGGVALLPTPEPALLLGKSVLSGRSVPELTFVIARHMATLRTTGRLLGFYPTLPDVKTLLSAAFAAAAAAAPASVSPDALVLARALGPKLDDPSRHRLTAAVARLAARGGQVDLLGWARAAELVSCRAALLACGDVTVAARMLSFDGRVIGGLSASDRLKALLPFSVSESYAQLRRAVGAAVAG